MKQLLAACSIALAFCAGTVHAQTAALAPAPAPAAADPAAVAAARDMLASMNYRAVTVGMLAQIRQSMPDVIRQSAAAAIDNNPQLDATQKTAALEKVKADMPKTLAALDSMFNDNALIDEMMQDSVQLYARHFTVAELRQIGAFYKTPVGAKMLTSMPQIMREAMESSQRIVMPRLMSAMSKIVAQ